MKNYLLYNHSESSERTLGSFFKKSKVFIGDNKTRPKDFLLFENELGVKNIDKVYERWTKEQQEKYGSIYTSIINNLILSDSYFESEIVLDLPLNVGTNLFLIKENFNHELVAISGKNLFLEQDDDFNFTWSEKLYNLTTTDGYLRSQKLSLGEGMEYNIELINQNIQVWVWIRALNKIINLSPFVVSCFISKTDVGTFSITFNPIKNIDRLAFDRDNSILHYFNLGENGKSNIDFIHQFTQMNDIVFIRFEKLQLEDKKNVINDYQIEIGKDQLQGRVWDMIGLVDGNSQRSNFSETNYEVSISGRDLMKLLTEDSSYWIQAYYLEGEKSIVGLGYNKTDRWFKRNFEGSFGRASNTPSPYQFTVGQRSIRDTISFIVNQLSNLGVTGDENLFENYGDLRTKAYRITGTEQSYEVGVEEVQGIWQIIKIFYDRALENRRVNDESLARVDGTIFDQFNKICQKPFVEFYGDTYGDEFNFIIRQPPFTKGAIRSFLEGVKYHPSMDESAPKQVVEKENIRLFEPIEIDLKDIQGYDNLNWDNTYYTSYSISPRNEILGQNTNILLGGMVPIIYIEEFARIFGNRRLVVQDNYITLPVQGNNKEDDNTYRNALLNDFKYLIDTNFYLPFTRRGTFTLVKGDRRIKKGIFIKVKPTNEIFYVDGVSNSVSFLGSRIERTTNVQVSRGMIEDYIFGSIGLDNDGSIISSNTGSPIKFSYFDILKTTISKVKSYKKVIAEKKVVNQSTSNEVYSVKIGDKNSPAGRNNNPGNLIYVRQASATQGDLKSVEYDKENKISKTTYWAKFPTPEVGFKEVIRQLGIYSNSEKTNTIEKAMNRYAPPSDNNQTNKYVDFICRRLNTSPDTLLNSLDKTKMAEAIIKMESSSSLVINKQQEEIKPVEQVEEADKIIETTETNLSWVFDEDQFNFFLGRKQFNLQKIKRNE